MKNKILFPVVVLLVLLAGLAAYLFWPSGQPEPASAPVAVAPLPAPPAPPAPIVQPAESPVAKSPPPPVLQLPLPPLTRSDGLVLEKLAGLGINQTLMALLRPGQIIQNIVVTVDNLPRRRVPAKVMPFKSPQGKFLVSDAAGQLTVSPDNAKRYVPYVNLAKAVDSRKLVQLYVWL